MRTPRSAADRHTRNSPAGSPGGKPHATLALVTIASMASSSARRQTPKPSPKSALRSIPATRLAYCGTRATIWSSRLLGPPQQRTKAEADKPSRSADPRLFVGVILAVEIQSFDRRTPRGELRSGSPFAAGHCPLLRARTRRLVGLDHGRAQRRAGVCTRRAMRRCAAEGLGRATLGDRANVRAVV